jgi:hypothetical protein
VLRHRIIIEGDTTQEQVLELVLDAVPVPETATALVYA